jgi:hypothetical protein
MQFSSSSERIQHQLEEHPGVHSSTNNSDREMSEENSSGRSRSSVGNTAMAGASMVAPTSTVDSEKGGAWRKYRSITARFSNENQELKTSSGEVDHVQNFLQTISPEQYREAMKWILEIAMTSNLDIQVILKYIRTFGRGALRKKLHGWLDFYRYCTLKELSVEQIVQSDSVKLISDFLFFLQQQGVKDYIVKEAKYATSTLFEDILGKIGSGKNKIIAALITPENYHIRHRKKYEKMWNITLLFDYYRKQPENSLLADFDIMIKAAILILIFTACRPCEVVLIRTDSIEFNPETESLILPTITKQNKFEFTNFQVQKLSDNSICPVAATQEWLARRKSLTNAPPNFLISKTGKPVRDAQLLANAVRNVLDAVGVPPQYSPYTIKHATISALFALGVPTTEVNIFTGHSESANTAPSYYLKTIGNWPDYRLAAFSSPGESGETMAPEDPEQ